MTRDDELYGPLWDPSTIERAALARIEQWEPAHLAAKERADGLPPLSLKPAKLKLAGGVFDWQPAQHLPMLLLVVGDTTVEQQTRTAHTGQLDLEVTVVVDDKQLDRARNLARRMAAAYASILLAHPFLESAAKVSWDRDETELAQLGDRQGRRVAAAARVLTIDFSAGPSGRGAIAPPDDPYLAPESGPVSTAVKLTVTPEHEDH